MLDEDPDRVHAEQSNTMGFLKGCPFLAPFMSIECYSGDCSLCLDKTPADGVVIAVMSNTDYVYNGESARKAHFD